MDSEDTKRQKRVFSLLALRFCTVIVFSVVSFFVLSFILGVLVIILGELWVSSSTSSASLASRCKILSSSVDLRSSKVCGIGLLNNKAQHVFHPFERDKFRCRYDYYWASVFKVEYKDHLMGQTRLAFSEAPNEALPPECRPNFGAALLTKDNFKAGSFNSSRFLEQLSKVNLFVQLKETVSSSWFGFQAPFLTRYLTSETPAERRVLTTSKCPFWEANSSIRTKYITDLGLISRFLLVQTLASSISHVTVFLPTLILKIVCLYLVDFDVLAWIILDRFFYLGLVFPY
ncbi:hypothetical protein YC2023_008313 [Brassica napus]